jgi:hypothetical protein
MKWNLQMFAEAIMYSSIQFAIASVEMSSSFSVKNFAKDQETLNNAKEALFNYMKVGLYWTLGNVILLYCKYGTMGAVAGFATNLAILGWMSHNYHKAFQFAVDKHNLIMPKFF